MAGSLRGYVSDYPAVLICEMSDGTRRLVVTSRGVPTGSYDDSENVELSIDPSPAPYGTTEEQPPSVPFDFLAYNGVAANYPFEPILGELLFTSYEYDSEERNAIWSACLFVDGVNLNQNTTWVVPADTSAMVLAIFQ